MKVKSTRVKPTTLLPLDEVEVLVMTKETAAKVILDLFQDASNIGASRVVLRTEDNRYFILQVKEAP